MTARPDPDPPPNPPGPPPPVQPPPDEVPPVGPTDPGVPIPSRLAPIREMARGRALAAWRGVTSLYA